MGAKGSKKILKKDPTVLLDAEIELLIRTTRYDRSEIKKWHAGFIKDCPKGKLNKKTFIDIYRKFYPEGKADRFCSHVFKAFDLDGSGEIDFIEFLFAISIISQGDTKEKLLMSFNLFDIDKNGRIEKKEMEKLIVAIYDLLGEEDRTGCRSPHEKVKEIMSKLDKDCNGEITADEFVQGCLNDEHLRQFLSPTIAM